MTAHMEVEEKISCFNEYRKASALVKLEKKVIIPTKNTEFGHVENPLVVLHKGEDSTYH